MRARAELFLQRLIPALGLACLACAGTPADLHPGLPLESMDTRVQLQLSAPPGAPVTRLGVTVLITPLDGKPFTVQGVRDAGSPEERSLMDLVVHWEDFRGDQPTSRGQSERFVLPFGSGGTAAPDAPLAITREVQLPEAPGVLARRVRAGGRIIGVDLQREHAHSGGQLLTLPETTLQSFAPVPEGSLRQHLQTLSPAGIFLSAASTPESWHDQVVATLVEALPATPLPARDAVFAALLYLTGETHGRDIYRWSSWWKERAAALPKG